MGQPVMMTPSNAIAKIPNASPCPALHNENSSYSNVNLRMIRKTAIVVPQPYAVLHGVWLVLSYGE